MNQTLVIPLETAEKIAAMGVKEKSNFYYWRLLPTEPFVLLFPEWDRRTLQSYVDAYPSAELYPTYTLGELSTVLQEIGKIKKWKTLETTSASWRQWEDEFLEICRLHVEDPSKGWSYLDNLLK